MQRDKEDHYIMLNGSVQQEEIKAVNIHLLNVRAPQDTKANISRPKGIDKTPAQQL